jgi:nucleoside-diphosphate-sugar epimerase
MRVLVTGHLGYLGSVLVPLLLDEGHEVVGLDSGLFRACRFTTPDYEVPTIRRDIRDVRADDLYGFDAVLHLAGLSNDPLGDINPKVTYDINYTAAVQLASLAKYANVRRFVLSSTCAVYGSTNKRYVLENSALHPLTTFALAKMRAETDIARLADAQFTPVYLRKPIMYGISPYHRTDTSVNNLVAWAAVTGRVLVKSDGQSWRPVMHVEDVARAFIAALYAPTRLVDNQAINVCRTEENYQVRTLAEIVQRTLPHTRIEYVTDAPHDVRSYRVDGSKLANLMPTFMPEWTLEQGIVQLYEAYQIMKLKLDDFEGARYKRVAYLKQLLAAGEIDNNLRLQHARASAGM